MTARFVAHRGANNEAPNNQLPHLPENTLQALRHAYEVGVEYVECDVHQTSDNQIIVLHDDTISRTARYNVDLATTLTSAEFEKINCVPVNLLSYQDHLSQVDVGCYADYLGETYRATRVPLLSEFFIEVAKDARRKLLIELKPASHSIVSLLKQLIGQSSEIQHDQLILISFDFELIQAVKKALPNYQCLLLTVSSGEDALYHNRIQNADDLMRIIEWVKEAGLDGLGVEYDPLLLPVFQLLAGQPFMSMVWTYTKDDTVEMARNMLPLVDLINTNQPEVMLAM